MSSESQPCGVDVPSYSVEEVESATSEYVVKNGVSSARGGASGRVYAFRGGAGWRVLVCSGVGFCLRGECVPTPATASSSGRRSKAGRD